MNKDEEMGHFP